jgi:hypothetical protein
MQNYPDYIVIELDQRRLLKPHWLKTKAASFAVRPTAVRAPVVRKRNKSDHTKVGGTQAKAQTSPLGVPSNGHESNMGGSSNSGARERLQAYPDFIAKALSAADEAQAAGESELTVALVEVVCELLYEVGRRA